MDNIIEIMEQIKEKENHVEKVLREKQDIELQLEETNIEIDMLKKSISNIPCQEGFVFYRKIDTVEYFYIITNSIDTKKDYRIAQCIEIGRAKGNEYIITYVLSVSTSFLSGCKQIEIKA